MTKKATVYLVKYILYAPVIVSGRHVDALVDTGASISLVNKNIVDPENIRSGQPIEVHSYDDNVKLMQNWTTLEVEFKGKKIPVEALVAEDVEFVFILSRPDMKRFQMNISWKDEVTLDHNADSPPATPVQMLRTVKRSEDVPISFPELICVESYQPATSVIEVPFKLRDTSVVRKKTLQHVPRKEIMA